MAERMIRRWRFERAAPASSASKTPGVVSAKERLAALAGHLRDPETAVEPARTLPVLARCEVLVVGGGPAGLSAALAAARAGADTVLVEQGPCFGGTITQVGIETLGWYRYPGTANDATGIGRELERAAAGSGAPPASSRTTTRSASTPSGSSWWRTGWCSRPGSGRCSTARWSGCCSTATGSRAW